MTGTSVMKEREAAKLAYANEGRGYREVITSQKLGSPEFWRIANSVLNKGIYLVCLLYIMARGVVPSI